ncbi:MAG: YcaQ family DNA glycosylase [Armatimonadetes bacterium]|nr:YcaQ family DNA glycosylase [Armatimonadota bacterium]
MQVLAVSRADARAFLLRAFALDGFQTLPTVADAVETLGFVQEDSINVCGRMHDLVLRNRVQHYRPADLSRYLYGEPRRAFEYYLPNLCVLPLADYPYFLPAMRSRRDADGRYGKLSPEEEAAASVLLSAIDTSGAIFLRDTKGIGDAHGHTVSGWGTRTRLLSFVADKLFWHGTLGISRRDGFLRSFDRAENLFPAAVLNAPVLEGGEATRQLMRKKLQSRRLFRLRAVEKAALGENETMPVLIEGDPKPWHILTDDLPLLTNPAPSAPPTLFLLAPLDPLVYDRARTRFLFDFDYTWEVYVPEAKRKWGYYVLPVLLGDRLVGRIEPRVDKTGAVRVVSQSWESGFDAGAITDPLAERLAGLTTPSHPPRRD